MKTLFFVTRMSLVLSSVFTGAYELRADVNVRLSVKFILKPDGTRPGAGDIGTRSGFDAEVRRGNQVLAATGRGFHLAVVEYADVRPPVPAGRPSDYWFNMYARDNRWTIETAALADTSTWAWNVAAINVYVNNSSSGACSFVGNGLSISLGNDIGTGTVLHEIGHFFDLLHTHAGDYNGSVGDWSDGDGLTETLPDDPDAGASDINARYPNETQQKRDDLIHNVMSYHNEDRLLPVQMDIWTENALGPRRAFCGSRTWFVANGGSDAASGDNEGSPFATLARALSSASTSVGPLDDDIVMRSGTYTAPSGNLINTACTLRATRGPVTILHP